MTSHTIYRRKPFLSLHQKQMRFFTGLSVIVCTVVVFALFWGVNRLSYILH